MSTKKNRFDFATPEQKLNFLNEIIAFFQNERGEEIGLVGAEQILDFFTQNLGEEIYKRAITDSRKIIKQQLETLDVELGLLS